MAKVRMVARLETEIAQGTRGVRAVRIENLGY